MQQPPLLAEEVLVRVLRIARLDGLGVVFFAGFYALSAAAAGDRIGAAIGLAAAGAGALELHGAALLRHGEVRGIGWLISSQPCLLAAILAYCAYRLTHFEPPVLPEEVRALATASAQQLGLTLDEYFRFLNRLTAQLLALLSIAYQGGMMLYYFRRRHAVARALSDGSEER